MPQDNFTTIIDGRKVKTYRKRSISNDALICRARLIKTGYQCRIDSNSWCITMANRKGLV